jgi:AcrR family transcriptional regulator
LVQAGFDVLARHGAAGFGGRAVEKEAGLPHGSVRHHFTDRAGLLGALIDALLSRDLEHLDESVERIVDRLLRAERDRTLARYELMLMAMRDPGLRARIIAGRERLVDVGVQRGLSRSVARAHVAALDGQVLDALLRDRATIEAVSPSVAAPSVAAQSVAAPSVAAQSGQGAP